MDTTCSFRTDRKTKEEASLIPREPGTDISTVLNMCLRQIATQRGIPSGVSPEYNNETLETLDEVQEGKKLVGPFDTFDETKKALLA